MARRSGTIRWMMASVGARLRSRKMPGRAGTKFEQFGVTFADDEQGRPGRQRTCNHLPKPGNQLLIGQLPACHKARVAIDINEWGISEHVAGDRELFL